jgi:hypothetical protein
VPAGDLADQLGAVKAEIAVLEAREKTLRDELIRRGVSECQGAAFGASINGARAALTCVCGCSVSYTRYEHNGPNRTIDVSEVDMT